MRSDECVFMQISASNYWDVL